MTVIDKACFILEKTRDGNDLTPQDLKLTENAVNGFLNEKGLEAFEELYKTVEAGEYKRPAYLGVEFMDRDQNGHVYFKGQHVEDYAGFYAYSLAAKADLQVLQNKCLFVEKLLQPLKRVSECSWPLDGELAEAFCKEQKERLDQSAEGLTLTFSRVTMQGNRFFLPGHPPLHHVMDSQIYRELCKMHRCETMPFTVTAYSYGGGQDGWREANAEELVYLQSCFHYLKDKEFLRDDYMVNTHFGEKRPIIPDEMLMSDDIEDDNEIE